MGDYETAPEVLNKAIALQKLSESKTALTYSCMRIGNIHRKFLNGTEKSVLFYNNALKLSKELKNDFLTASLFGSFANAFLYLHENTKADRYCSTAAELFEKAGNKFLD